MENSDLVKEATRRHPPDRLSTEEVGAAVRTLRTRGPASDHFRFSSVNLHEPAKSELESISIGNTLDRRALIVVIALPARHPLETLLSLRDETPLSCQRHYTDHANSISQLPIVLVSRSMLREWQSERGR
jgi:Cu2+-containing amine oxidase